jgi:hypothetical protein
MREDVEYNRYGLSRFREVCRFALLRFVCVSKPLERDFADSSTSEIIHSFQLAVLKVYSAVFGLRSFIVKCVSLSKQSHLFPVLCFL